ncbi:hypothetical protein CM19_01020 [Candidatus Acidianus copahuensis]|uniref:Uncharacterized protein n=1 Tax=Candidatus Acidianus copahuensis TaxID=1160895 RepID=A0A031LSH4_9CREN|nr:hypothetical protein [Candidatus Acidianus copahuensis]EZQ11337.1 hypothetical protein CM19_01020 [Candidatus Acidianus copahuensis]
MELIKSIGKGSLTLSDGTVITLVTYVLNVKETGFSPYGGVNFVVESITGITIERVPDELKEKVKDKTIPNGVPQDGWEIIDIKDQKPAIVELETDSSKGKFMVRAETEAVMASRNLNYRTPSNEPWYSVLSINKVSWRPLK